MSDEWDKDKLAVGVNKWEGEDEEEDVKDNWDDEEEEKESTPESEAPKLSVVSNKKKRLLKIAEKDKVKDRVDSKPLSAEELLADKLERQRLQEESDLLLAKEAFGDRNMDKTSGSCLDMSLNSREDFEIFKNSLIEKLKNYERSVHYINFLENLFRELCVSVEPDDIKKLSMSLNALFNEKIRAQKAITKPKKKGKGVSVKVERDVVYDAANNDLDDFDDFI